MTKEQAVERAAKALMRKQGYTEENWRMTGGMSDRAAEYVAILEEFELIKIEK
jgi:hypothetical protein